MLSRLHRGVFESGQLSPARSRFNEPLANLLHLLLIALPAWLGDTQTPASGNQQATSRSTLAPAVRPLCQWCHRSSVLPHSQEQHPVARWGPWEVGWYLQDARGALTPQSAQDEPPAAGTPRSVDGVLPSAVHAVVAVVLLGEDLAVGIIPAKQSWGHTHPIIHPHSISRLHPSMLVSNGACSSLALITPHSISPPA